MSLKYPFFISYAHGNCDGYASELISTFMTELTKSVGGEAGAYFENSFWIDRRQLGVGDALNQTLAQAICQSACFIVVFSPVYKRKPYCLAELHAALELEKLRLGRLDKFVPRGKRLVMTIVLRGPEHLPQALLEDERIYADFSSYLMGDTSLVAHNQKIKEMVATIYDRYEEITRAVGQGIDVCGDCEHFDLKLRPVTDTVAGFPYREGSK